MITQRWDSLAALLLRAFVALAMALGFTSLAQAQTVNRYTNTTDSAVGGINDTATPCNNRFLRTFTVAASYTLSDVNIGILAEHTYRGDLLMYLVSPAGTRVQIDSGVGAGADNFNALLDDEASSTLATYTSNDTAAVGTIVPPYNSSYRPSAALSAFDGQNSSGTWTLEICDNAAQDVGTFFQADLYLTQPPATYADLSLTKVVNNAAPATGASINYTLTLSNSGTSALTATGVVVRDVLPAGATFVSASGSGTYSNGTGDWAVGTIAPGQTRTLAITATVSATAGATITNTAEVTASSVADLDSIPNNGIPGEDDYASASFTVSGTRVAGTPPTLSCPVGTALLDWDALAWAAGSTSNSYTIANIGAIGFAVVNPGAFLNNATYGGQSPTRQNAATGGIAPAQYSLMELIDLNNRSESVSTTITLPTAVPGAQFTLFDIDFAAGQFADRVTVTGTYNGSPVTPTLTNGVANYVIGNTAYGDATAGDTQNNGNVVVTFGAPVDTIVISYGNHALAPANPGQQGIQLHDMTFCRPQAVVSLSKTSAVISDPANGTTNPKAIPGAVIEYCIMIGNSGSGTMTSVAATDAVPSTITYLPGTLKSGTTCATATTAEDDNTTGADESDPFGASITGATITGTAGSLAPASGFALKFQGSTN